MAKIERIVAEIIVECDKLDRNRLGYDLNYFKVQYLTYICHAVYYCMYQEYMSPSDIVCYPSYPGFMDIYKFFNKNKLEISNKQICGFDIGINSFDINSDELEDIYGDLFWFEEEVIDYVLNLYGDKKTDELNRLIKNDPLFQKLHIGDKVYLSRLSNFFVSEEDKIHIKDTFILKKVKKRTID